jgi:hypothetical protein
MGDSVVGMVVVFGLGFVWYNCYKYLIIDFIYLETEHVKRN